MKKINLLFISIVLMNAASAQNLSIVMIPSDVVGCEGESRTYYVTPQNPNSTYIWTGDFTGSPYTGTGINIAFSGPVNDWVMHVQENDSGILGPIVTSDTLDLLSDNLSTIITGPEFVWLGDTVVYSTPYASYTYYSWTTTGGIIIDTNNNSMSIVFDTAGTYGIDLYILTMCGSDSAHKNIVVNQAGICSATFILYPDTVIDHNWFLLATGSGTEPVSYLWEWGDGNTSTGANPSHTYSVPGYYNICLTITDANGCSASYCDSSTYVFKTGAEMISVNVINQFNVGIEEETESNSLLIYPNPATTEITVYGYSHAYLKLCDAVGQTVAESQSNKLYVGNLSQGLYVLQLFDAKGQQVKTEKVIVAK